MATNPSRYVQGTATTSLVIPGPRSRAVRSSVAVIGPDASAAATSGRNPARRTRTGGQAFCGQLLLRMVHAIPGIRAAVSALRRTDSQDRMDHSRDPVEPIGELDPGIHVRGRAGSSARVGLIAGSSPPMTKATQRWAVAVLTDRAMFAWATPGWPLPAGGFLLTEPARAETAAAAPPRSESRAPRQSPAAPLPADHPPLRPQRIGVLLLNLGTPDGTDYWSMRRYLKEFLSDERVIDVNPLLWKPLLNLVILTTRPVAQRQGLRGDLEPGAGRIAAAHHHPRAVRRARRSARRRLARPRPPGRLGDALRQAVDAGGDAQDGRGGLHPAAPVRPLSAVRRGDHRDRLRSGVPRAARGALAAGGAHRAALFRAPLVHRGARPLDRGPPRRALLAAGGRARVVPRPAQALPDARRPVPLPVRQDRRGCCARASAGTRAVCA